MLYGICDDANFMTLGTAVTAAAEAIDEIFAEVERWDWSKG